MNEPGMWLSIGFIFLSIVMVAGFVFCAESRLLRLGVIAWLVVTGLIGFSGVLQDFSGIPPRVVLMFFPALIMTMLLAFSGAGERMAKLPLWFLVGFQAFRIPVELLIHEAVSQGVAPPQLTWTGLNFDVVSGVTALLLFPFVGFVPKWILYVWNTVGLSLLGLVVTVAVLSFPTPLQQLTPDNIWVTHFPFIWLPTILVLIAVFGHLVLFRLLASIDKEK